MSNICDNTLYAESSNRGNIDTIIDFFDAWPYAEIEDSGESIDVYFGSKWTFPESDMNKLFELIPDKSNIYMRCLSVEYGTLYHELWLCDKDGWRTV